MTVNQQNLVKRAHQGDAESQYNLGWAYKFGEDGFNQDIQEAYKWLQLAAEKNHPKAQRHYAFFFLPGEDGSPSHVRHDINEAAWWLMQAGKGGDAPALWSHIGLYMAYGLTPETASDGIVECLRVLINTCRDPAAAIELGAIYCGSHNNRHIERFKGLTAYYNPKRGYKLIEEGIMFAEEMEENPLKYEHYSTVVESYFADTTKAFDQNQQHNRYFKGGDWIVAVAKEINYSKRALSALEKGICVVNYPKDVTDELIQNERSLITSIKKKLVNAVGME